MTGPNLPVEDLQVCSGTRTNRVNLDGLTEAHRLGRCRQGHGPGCLVRQRRDWDKAALGAREGFVRLPPAPARSS